MATSFTSAVSSTTKSQIDDLVAQYKITISKPLNNLNTQKTTLTTRKSSFSSLKSKLTVLRDDLKDLAKTDLNAKLNVTKVTSSDSDILTASTSGTAKAATHSVFVTNLAKADKMISDKFTKTDASDINAGSYSFKITLDGTSYNISTTIAAGATNSDVMQSLVTAINSSTANQKVTASYISDSSKTARIVLSSKNSGSSNAISVEDVSGDLLDSIGLTGRGNSSGRTKATNAKGGYLIENTSDLDAQLKVDGIDIVRGTNTIKDIVDGVTFELKGVNKSTDNDVAITVEIDKSKIKEYIQTFITEYNDAITFLNDKLTTVDGVRAELSGDSQLTRLRESMRSIVGGEVTSAKSGNPAFLESLGITTDTYGKLSLKYSYKLDDLLDSDPTKVYDLFNSTNGVANKLQTLIDPFVKSEGLLDKRVDQASTQIDSLVNRIKSSQEQIDRKGETYRKQYEKLLNAINNLNSQQSLISSMMSNTSSG
jgi:flagellar hook-associated protein 2